jgi:hypothetical protein
LIEHTVRTLIGQRVFGMALGYEDLNDHESLRHDPVFGTLLGKLEPRRRADCAALAGKSTLKRLELHESQGSSRYHKIRPEAEAIERLWMDLFLDAHREAPSEIILDLDATDDPLHGHQEGRFFHDYYDGYCYLPLYIFAGEHLLCAKLRRSNIDGAAGACEEVERIVAQIRERRSGVKIILRADSGFCREELMSWCEQNAVDYVFGLAKNVRLVRTIGAELQAAKAESRHTQRPARRFKELVYRTRSWCRPRRVVAKAEQTGDKANPRFIVTSLSMQQWAARELYEDFYCARGECENRIKEAQLDLFADRLSAATFRANQLRLWLASAACVLMHALRRDKPHPRARYRNPQAAHPRRARRREAVAQKCTLQHPIVTRWASCMLNQRRRHGPKNQAGGEKCGLVELCTRVPRLQSPAARPPVYWCRLS